jgi:acetyl/propionyl-CoA carboxylase alpha subunit
MALIVTVDDQEFRIQFQESLSISNMIVNGKKMAVTLVGQSNSDFFCIIDRKPYLMELISPRHIRVNGDIYEVSVIDERVKSIIKDAGGERLKKDLAIKAPMPGLIIDVLVNNNDIVEPGQSIVIIEAMKMQNEMKARSRAYWSRRVRP